MLIDAFANALLDGATAPSHLSLHTAWPGLAGSNEVTGGSYARQPVTFAAASARARAISATASFPGLAAGTTVRWVGAWSALSGGNFRALAPAGGQTPREYWCDLTADTIISPGHGYANDQTVVFYDGSAPGGLVEGTIYFVVGAATDTFQVSATQGGAAINLTAQPTTERAKVCRIIEQPFPTGGQADVTSFNYGLTH